ncbi:hypothetical protein SLE2022_024990 [Rubroshorea leprosula]
MEIGASLPSLVYLNILGNSLIGRISPSIGDMKFLESLNLSHNNLSGGIHEKLSMGCLSLSFFTLPNNNLQGQIFSLKMLILAEGITFGWQSLFWKCPKKLI